MSESSSQWEEGDLNAIATTLEEAGISLKTDDPTIPLNDMGSLQQRFEEATVIGIGESSHGIREFVRFRHRLLRYLVEELDYRIVGLEVNFSATSALTEYVTTGEGTAREVLSNAGIHPQWRTYAAVDLIEWVRDFNRDRASDDQVRFYGIDVQSGRPTARALASYLEQVDPDFLATVEEELQYVSNEQVNFEVFFRDSEQIDADKYCNTCHKLSSTLKSRFAQEKELYIDRSSERAFSRATRQAELLEVAGSIVAERGSENMGKVLELREEGLAENVSWVREHEQADQLVVFAHNSHVNRGGWPVKQWGDIPSMFDRIHDLEGGDAVSVGFSVGSAKYRVMDVTEDGWDHMQVSDPPHGSIPAVFSRMDEDTIVDLGAIPEDSVAAEWMASEPGRQGLNSKNDSAKPAHYMDTDPRTIFDVLLFAHSGSPAEGFQQ